MLRTRPSQRGCSDVPTGNVGAANAIPSLPARSRSHAAERVRFAPGSERGGIEDVLESDEPGGERIGGGVQQRRRVALRAGGAPVEDEERVGDRRTPGPGSWVTNDDRDLLRGPQFVEDGAKLVAGEDVEPLPRLVPGR